jgi:hypothetical protein
MANQIKPELNFSRKIMLGTAGLIAAAGPLTVGIVNAPVIQAQARFGANRPVFEAFEVATIKPAATEPPGRYFRMQSAHQFYAKNYTLKALVALAWDLTPAAISGGPSWVDSDHSDILAETPNEIRPNRDEQMSMLKKLLIDRFKLTFHREQKEFSRLFAGGRERRAQAEGKHGVPGCGARRASAAHLYSFARGRAAARPQRYHGRVSFCSTKGLAGSPGR